jgi:xanthine dehydrogenase accessory factor
MTIVADPIVEGNDGAAGRPPGAVTYYRQFRKLVETGQGCTEAVVMAPEPLGLPAGNRYLFDADSRLVAQSGSGPCPEEMLSHLVALTRRPGPSVHQGIAYLPVLPRITLLIVGGGHVGQYVARLASEVDFDIWVLDDRERYANQERFPTARRHLVGDIGVTLKQLAERDINANVYCLIVTRGHNHDEEALYHLAGTSASYIGMIGSKRKIKLIYEDLVAKGIPEETLRKVHAPLGFAIGSQTVPEIAISIMAELIACRNLGATIPEARIRGKTGPSAP